ncbi:hypothetical protein YC2023_065757 [Brassica napus]
MFSKQTVLSRHSCQEVHHLTIYRRYLKAGSMFSLSGFDVRLFLNATSGRQLYFDKETNAEETYFTSKYLVILSLLRPDLVCSMTYPLHALTGYCPSLHIISFTAEGLIQEVEFVCPMKVTGFNMDKGWCYVSCSRCTKKLQRTVSSFTWQPAVTPMQLVSFDMLDPKMRSHRHISN